MKRFLFSIVSLLIALAAMAQHSVKGIIVEAGTEEPMVQTTVRLLK